MWSKNKLLAIISCLTLFALTSCYRAPTEDDYCTRPSTNNPSVTRHAESFKPGISY